MAAKINDIVKNLLDGMHSLSQSDTIMGEPTKVGDATVIPVHRLRVGFVAASLSAGGHASESEGSTGGRGVGGTAQVEPVAVLAIGPDGRPRLLAVDGDAEGTWQRLVRDVPDLVTKAVGRLAEMAERPRAAAAKTADALPAAAEPAKLPEKKREEPAKKE